MLSNKFIINILIIKLFLLSKIFLKHIIKNTYNVVQTIGKTYFGGVYLDFIQSYQSVSTDFLVNSLPKYAVKNTDNDDIIKF